VLPEGFPTPSLPWTGIGDLATLAAAAVGITLVSLTDTIATSSAFAARRGDEVDANHEMIAVGASNAAAGLFQGFAISVSSSRTAVAESSGAKTQLTGLVGAVIVILLLVFLPGLLADLPQAALAAVVIMAAVSLADLGVLRRFGRVRKSALALSLIATVGVVFFGVLEGILIAAILSILLFFKRSWWPEGAVLGYVRDLRSWHSVERYPDAEQTKNVVIYRWEAPLFFANAGIFREQIRKLVRQRKPHWVVLQCEAITDIDVTAADMLKGLDRELNDQGIHLAFVELRDRLQDRVERYGLLEELDQEHFFAKMKPALRDIAAHDPDSDDVPHRWQDALDEQDSDY
jgi:MFS superfamily sulfate permease-like transporter